MFKQFRKRFYEVRWDLISQLPQRRTVEGGMETYYFSNHYKEQLDRTGRDIGSSDWYAQQIKNQRKKWDNFLKRS